MKVNDVISNVLLGLSPSGGGAVVIFQGSDPHEDPVPQASSVLRLMILRHCWEMLHNRVAPLKEDLELLASDPPQLPCFTRGHGNYYKVLLAHCEQVCTLT